MIEGAPNESQWTRSEPRRAFPAALIQTMIHAAFPGQRVMDALPLIDGLRNANFKVQLDSAAEPIVLRIYEHDASICQKEVDLIRFVGHSVPVAEVIHAEPHGTEDFPPFALFRWIDGINLRELKRQSDVDAIAEAAYSAGQILAFIGRITFPKPGWLGPGPTPTAPLLEGEDAVPRFVDLCLAAGNLQQRMKADLRDRTHALTWHWAARLAHFENDRSLVHNDFGNRNLMAKNAAGKWMVAAVLDWEFAVSGSPLADLGHFLRYERAERPLLEPHFSTGYSQNGGALPQDWRQLARLLDLVALCESLTRDKLPPDVEAELLELVRATVENRDPQVDTPTR
jgi:aminoglycoside phosphotransferase (APT) family kinase protein